jgi:hypothetical protein
MMEEEGWKNEKLESFGDQFRFVRGKGLVKRNEPVTELGEKK